MNVKRAIIFLILAVCIVTLVSRLVHLQYFKDALHLKRNDNETGFHHNRTNLIKHIDFEFSQNHSYTSDANLNVSENVDVDRIDNKLYRMKYDRKRRNSSGSPLSQRNNSNSGYDRLYTIVDKNNSQVDYEKRDKVKQVHV